MSKLTVEQIEEYRPHPVAGKDCTIGVPAPIMRQFCDTALASVRDAEPVAEVVQAAPYQDGTPDPHHILLWAGRNCENDLPVGTKLYLHPTAHPSADEATVPMEPTEEMIDAALHWRDRLETDKPTMRGQFRAFYKAMLSAAPPSSATGWAVFEPDGKLITASVRTTENAAWRAGFGTRNFEDRIKRMGYTCQRVAITRLARSAT